MAVDDKKSAAGPPKPPSPAGPPPDYEKQAAENLAGWQRERANFENFKKEVKRAQAAMAQLAALDLVVKLVPVLTDFERALAHRPPPADEAAKAWLNGVTQVQKQLTQVLKDEGITEVAPAINAPFDPHRHEAVVSVEAKGVAAGHVAELLEKGYCLHQRLIKPARVTVAK